MSGRTCPVCGGANVTPRKWATAMVRTAFDGSDVVRCARCGLDYMHPVPAPDADLYEEDYFKAYHDAGMVFPTEAVLHPRYAARLALAGRRTRGRRLLEIGVGHGAFLQLAAGAGWDVTGLDVSRYAAAYVHQRYGLPVICGSIEASDLPQHSYDVVHLSHVLEHLPDPVGVLRRIQTLLAPGGVVAIEVPNELENLYVRLRRTIGHVQAYPVACTHVTFFTGATLRRTLVEASFAPIVIRTLRDETDPRVWRRQIKRMAGWVERPLGCAPLVEALASIDAAHREDSDS